MSLRKCEGPDTANVGALKSLIPGGIKTFTATADRISEQAKSTRLARRYAATLIRDEVDWSLLIVDVAGDSGGWDELREAPFADCLVVALEWSSRGLASVHVDPPGYGF